LFGINWINVNRHCQRFHVDRELGKSLARSTRCQILSRVPFNQLFELSVEHVPLPVQGLPEALVGLKIAHFTDVHLTGDVHPEYLEFVMAQAIVWQPDVIVMTGDIIDAKECIDWLPRIFGSARANEGMFFVLGNHDKRVPDPRVIRNKLVECGWTDLGGRVVETSIRSHAVEWIGNEYPWFPKPRVPEPAPNTFRILLSHSPDQFSWARSQDVQLMFAGHTHGGQGRLPLAGPILGPSYDGSRFASGNFYMKPTTLHVSRGMGGTHLLRLRCPPELSLVELK
jgi:hypothetical protein